MASFLSSLLARSVYVKFLSAPTARSLNISATNTGILTLVSRSLGVGSVLSLTSTSSSNLSIDQNGIISASTALGYGATQVAIVREVQGYLAVEYPVTITTPASASVSPAYSPSLDHSDDRNSMYL